MGRGKVFEFGTFVQFREKVQSSYETCTMEMSLFWVVQDEAHHRWKNHHVKIGPPSDWRWHTVVHVPLMFLSEWRAFPSAPCLAGKKTWWQLAFRCCWNRARRLTCFPSASVTRKDLQFGTWTDLSFQWHYRFRPTTSGSSSGYRLISTPTYSINFVKLFSVRKSIRSFSLASPFQYEAQIALFKDPVRTAQ